MLAVDLEVVVLVAVVVVILGLVSVIVIPVVQQLERLVLSIMVIFVHPVPVDSTKSRPSKIYAKEMKVVLNVITAKREMEYATMNMKVQKSAMI